MATIENRETQVGVRMRSIDRDLLDRIADADRVTISAAVRRLIHQEALRRGFAEAKQVTVIAELPEAEVA